MAPHKGVNPYLRTQILTASPEELRLMLFDGALKFCKQARPAIEQGDLEASYEALSRAKKIVLELSTGMDRKQAPEVAEKMSALYTFIFKKLVDANMQRDLAPLDEAIGLLEYERETWKMLIDKSKGNPDNPAPKLADTQPPTQSPARQTALSTYANSA
ncbi:MAG: flagellar export chaperone FliS [Planctomycetota bacterium]